MDFSLESMMLTSCLIRVFQIPECIVKRKFHCDFAPEINREYFLEDRFLEDQEKDGFNYFF